MMRSFTFDELKNAFDFYSIEYTVLQKGPRELGPLQTDSRQASEGDFFVALQGESFNGHDFLNEELLQKISGVLLHTPEKIKVFNSEITVIMVKDTLLAFQALGSWVRKHFKGPVIAITGSNGKTTTKEFAASVLSENYSVHWSKGSFNNHWGVPITLLELQETHTAVVVEMGMNHAGELKRLVEIADPTVIVCTTVGMAHIEHFGSIEKIAEAKEEIYRYANPKGVFIFNGDNPWTRQMWEKYRGRVKSLFFSGAFPEEANVSLRGEWKDLQEMTVYGHIGGVESSAIVPLFGLHNVVNLMAAASVGMALGMTPEILWKGLSRCRTIWGRSQFVALSSGAQALFDAYNANPESMEALLSPFETLPPGKTLVGVFGEMLEMGEQGALFHENLGKRVGTLPFRQVYFLGKSLEAFEKGLRSSPFKGDFLAREAFEADFAQAVSSNLKSTDLILFKGSRGMRLERVLEACSPISFHAKRT